MNQAELKKKLMEKVVGAQQDKQAFKEIEQEINKSFFNYQCVYEELTFLIWDIPKQKDDEEKIKGDIEKAFVPEMASLARMVKNQHGIKHNFVQVTGTFNDKGKSISLMFGKDEKDLNGIMITIDKK